MTRREFLKKAFLGAGLLLTNCSAWGRERGRDRSGPLPISADNPSIAFTRRRCCGCGLCRGFCADVKGVFGRAVPARADACTYCGQCTKFCPERAITERYSYEAVNRAIAAPDRIVVATTAPAIRVALGEMYGMAPGTDVEGRIVGALRGIGVDHVVDATFAADLTVMEEASELLQRIRTAGPLPMFTSCCPAWIRFARLFYPRLLPNLSTVKSPLLMQGALIKTHFAQRMGIDPARITTVALTPCTAKKAEILMQGMNSAGLSHGAPAMRDVDFALTCREIAYLLNLHRVDFPRSAAAPYSPLMGTGSGAGMIFGNSGGVMEASLRTAFRLLNDRDPPAGFFNLTPVRGPGNVRRATVDMGARSLNVAVVHGTGGARGFLDEVQRGTSGYDFIEFMACSGGCVGGGGQPIPANPALAMRLRTETLFRRDEGKPVRMSHDNPQITAIYRDFLGEPMGARAMELLHTYHD